MYIYLLAIYFDVQMFRSSWIRGGGGGGAKIRDSKQKKRKFAVNVPNIVQFKNSKKSGV